MPRTEKAQVEGFAISISIVEYASEDNIFREFPLKESDIHWQCQVAPLNFLHHKTNPNLMEQNTTHL